MNDLIHEINGLKYLLVEFFVADKNILKDLLQKCEKYDCIFQGVKQVKQGWFSSYMILNILVPESNLIAFNKDNL